MECLLTALQLLLRLAKDKMLAVTAGAGMLLIASCTGNGMSSPTGVVPFANNIPAAEARSPITHVVIMIQEGRSFDDLFATFPGADGTTYGYTRGGRRVSLHRARLESAFLCASYRAFVTDYDQGKMDGFGSACKPPSEPPDLEAYQYVDPAVIRPYWTAAQQYVLADHMFERQSSGDFVGHQDLIAPGTAVKPGENLVDAPTSAPWGCDALPGTRTSLLTHSGG